MSSISTERPRVTLSPTYIQAEEYNNAEVECRSSGSQSSEFSWERLSGEIAYHVSIDGGYLRFNSIRKSDEGEYRCTARTAYGEDSQILRVFVNGGQQQPPPRPPPPQSSDLVQISPPSFHGQTGEEVRLDCYSPVGGRLVWSKEGLATLPYYITVHEGLLIISRASVEDSGQYVCTSHSHGSTSSSCIAQVVIGTNMEPPHITQFQEAYNIVQGSDFTLDCVASGNPMPRIKWTREHDSFNENTQQSGNSLRILNANPYNRGVYTCIADSDHGSTQESTVIDVERKLKKKLYLIYFFLK